MPSIVHRHAARWLTVTARACSADTLTCIRSVCIAVSACSNCAADGRKNIVLRVVGQWLIASAENQRSKSNVIETDITELLCYDWSYVNSRFCWKHEMCYYRGAIHYPQWRRLVRVNTAAPTAVKIRPAPKGGSVKLNHEQYTSVNNC